MPVGCLVRGNLISISNLHKEKMPTWKNKGLLSFFKINLRNNLFYIEYFNLCYSKNNYFAVIYKNIKNDKHRSDQPFVP